MLDKSISLNLPENATSKELQLLLERKRLPASSINSYEFHKKSGKIVFEACNSLYSCMDTGFNVSIIKAKLKFVTICVLSNSIFSISDYFFLNRRHHFSRLNYGQVKTKTGRRSIQRSLHQTLISLHMCAEMIFSSIMPSVDTVND